jgi:hypothetical protein
MKLIWEDEGNLSEPAAASVQVVDFFLRRIDFMARGNPLGCIAPWRANEGRPSFATFSSPGKKRWTPAGRNP